MQVQFSSPACLRSGRLRRWVFGRRIATPQAGVQSTFAQMIDVAMKDERVDSIEPCRFVIGITISCSLHKFATHCAVRMKTLFRQNDSARFAIETQFGSA